MRKIPLLLCLGLASVVGFSGCNGLGSAPVAATPPPVTPPTPPVVPPPTPKTITAVNHIIWHLQENRSFDNYFGQLNAYRTGKGLAADVDGLKGTESNPDVTGSSQVQVYHQSNYIIENISAAWNETHVSFSLQYNQVPGNQVTTYPMDGFVYAAGTFAQHCNADPTCPYAPMADTQGIRAMGYYDQNDLPYYYFMATQYATSDRMFSPAPTRTTPNRLFGLAATAQGWTYPPSAQLSAKTIFDELTAANISWKIYVDPAYKTYLNYFTTSNNPAMQANVRPLSEYYTDLQNKTLPQVAYIDQILQDEHPDEDIRCGAASMKQIVDAFVNSSSYSDSVFFLAWDEAGGTYDHVSPQKTVAPDSSPILLERPTDIIGDFTLTGARVPFLAISSFTKPGYVSHTAMDYTAILRYVEQRFLDKPGSPVNLTLRDAAQPSMDEFFDYTNQPNVKVPSTPAQPVPSSCPSKIDLGG